MRMSLTGEQVSLRLPGRFSRGSMFRSRTFGNTDGPKPHCVGRNDYFCFAGFISGDIDLLDNGSRWHSFSVKDLERHIGVPRITTGGILKYDCSLSVGPPL